MILVKDFDNRKDASLLKARLKENNINAYANGAGSIYQNNKFLPGQAVAVPNESLEKAINVLQIFESEQRVGYGHKVFCPNCVSRPLMAGDMVKGEFFKTMSFYWSAMGTRLSNKKDNYHVCSSCGLEFT